MSSMAPFSNLGGMRAAVICICVWFPYSSEEGVSTPAVSSSGFPWQYFCIMLSGFFLAVSGIVPICWLSLSFCLSIPQFWFQGPLLFFCAPRSVHVGFFLQSSVSRGCPSFRSDSGQSYPRRTVTLCVFTCTAHWESLFLAGPDIVCTCLPACTCIDEHYTWRRDKSFSFCLPFSPRENFTSIPPPARWIIYNNNNNNRRVVSHWSHQLRSGEHYGLYYYYSRLISSLICMRHLENE